jgi:hypothetical protein
LVTVQLYDGGVASTLPARSVARSRNVWVAYVRYEYEYPEEHGCQAALSNLHSNRDFSLTAKKKLADLDVVDDGGVLVSLETGAVVSVFHDTRDGVPSTLPAGSTATTAKV